MAFIRSYSYQGDPRLAALIRSGFARPAPATRKKLLARPVFTAVTPGVQAAFDRRRVPWMAYRGDPFFGGIGKFFKKAAKAVKKFQPGKFIAKTAVPLAATVLTGGIGGLAAAGLSALANRGRPVPPEDVAIEQPPAGPVSEVIAETRAAATPDWDAFFATLSPTQLRALAAQLGVSE